jgi:RNA polymerase sigma-54 factor
VWVFCNPPEALANRAALLRLRVSTQVAAEHVTAARWFVRALRQRLQAYQKIAQAVVTLRPELATVPGGDVKPVKKRELADVVGMHESTIARVAAACVVQNRRAVFALEQVVR